MRILALDLATRTGFAHGKGGKPPLSGSVRLKRPDEPREIAPFNLLCFLRDQFEAWAPFGLMPDLVLIEDFLDPKAQPSGKAVITQLYAHGLVQGFVRSYGIRIEAAKTDSIRKHLLGFSRARRGAPPDWIKLQVIAENKRLGLLDPHCRDLDRSDAVALWAYGQFEYAGLLPSELVMPT